MGRSKGGGRMWKAPARSASPAGLEFRFEHERSPESAARIERPLAGTEDPDGSG